MATFKFSNEPRLWPEHETCTAWRWYYRHPDTGQMLESAPMTPGEIVDVDPKALPVPGSAVEMPKAFTWDYPTSQLP